MSDADALPRATAADIDVLLQRADEAIAAGEQSMRKAADYIAQAQEKGATQRAIAAKLGRSQPWVNRLLRWRAGGFVGEAFNRAARRSSADQPADHLCEQQAETPEQADGLTAEQIAFIEELRRQREAERRAREQARAWDDAGREFHMFDFNRRPRLTCQHAKDRETLVRALGMLGSNQDGEVLSAARTVERLRKKLGLQWSDLIVEPDQDGTIH